MSASRISASPSRCAAPALGQAAGRSRWIVATATCPTRPSPARSRLGRPSPPIRPDTAHSRSLRFLDTAGELLAAAFIIGGGIVLTGFATLL